MTAGVYLEAYLAPLAPWLSRADVTDVLINRPGEVWIETTDGTMSREPADQLTEVALQRLARQIAASSRCSPPPCPTAPASRWSRRPPPAAAWPWRCASTCSPT
jgi:hypothetical protein